MPDGSSAGRARRRAGGSPRLPGVAGVAGLAGLPGLPRPPGLAGLPGLPGIFALLLLSFGFPASSSGAAPAGPGPAGLPGGSPPPRRPARASIPLPLRSEGWTRPDTVRLLHPDELYDFMDGGAEVYLSYRFLRCETCEYTHSSEDAILLEIYFMETSDDAFGLLSLDWAGEPVELRGESAEADGRTVREEGREAAREEDPPRALYSGGLLRLWSDDVFIRILTYRETAASKKAVLALARGILEGRRDPPPPACYALMAGRRPGGSASGSRPSFFRTYVALNSIFPLGPRDPLALDLACSGVLGSVAAGGADPATTGRQAGSGSAGHVLVIRYPDPSAALRALKTFRTFFPDPRAGEEEVRGESALSDGTHVGTFLEGRTVGLAFWRDQEGGIRSESERLVDSVEGGTR